MAQTQRIQIVDGAVLRPTQPWTGTVHRYLAFLRDAGFKAAPAPLEDSLDGRARVEYLPGEVGNYPVPARLRSREALISSARLLRELHDVGTRFRRSDRDLWMVPQDEASETICHGDFGAYNCVYTNGIATHIIDFDTAHPAPRMWDVSYALYRFAPLASPKNSEAFGNLDYKLSRARDFCDAYGLDAQHRPTIAQAVARRLQALIDFMEQMAAAGDEKFGHDIERGDSALYRADILWITENSEEINSKI